MTWRKARQAKAARTRLGREGRRRSISRRRSSPRANKVVGAGSAGGGSGGCREAMAIPALPLLSKKGRPASQQGSQKRTSHLVGRFLPAF
jgi:hypothetical protein